MNAIASSAQRALPSHQSVPTMLCRIYLQLDQFAMFRGQPWANYGGHKHRDVRTRDASRQQAVRPIICASSSSGNAIISARFSKVASSMVPTVSNFVPSLMASHPEKVARPRNWAAQWDRAIETPTPPKCSN